MKRKSTETLKTWFKDAKKRPLILRGARQVGKSTLVRIFCQERNIDLFEINLEKTKIKSFEQENFNIDHCISEIEFIIGKSITKNTLIFIDEIQIQPNAVSRLRYFYEEKPDVAVIAAGSLLEIALHQNEIAFPVGRVSYLWLSPMTFTEYLIAINREDLSKQILAGSVPEFVHEIIQDEIKKYFFIGGMPKAIQTYLDTKSLIQVRTIQNEILQSYSNDFPKYEKKSNVEKIQKIFETIPFHLGQKLIYQHIDRDSRVAPIKKTVDLLIKAHLLVPNYHTNASGVPLKASVDHSILKIYFLDIGLVNAAHQLSWDTLENLFNQSFLTKGFLAEQFISQHLAYHTNPLGGPETLFWLKDKSLNKAEIDFVISFENKIIPIEIKAGKGGRLKSFQVFAKEKKIKKGYKFSSEFFNTEKIKIDEKNELQVENWPYYAIEGFIKKFLDQVP